MSSDETFYTAQHIDLTFDSYIRDNPVEVEAMVIVDKRGEVDEIVIEKIMLKSSAGTGIDGDTIQLYIDGLGSWYMDQDEGIGKYKDVTEQIEEEIYDRYIESRDN